MELEIMRFIQQMQNSFTIPFFSLITMLGETYTTVLIIAIIYYLYDKKAGKKLVLLMGTSVLFNSGLKSTFNRPRPIGEAGINSYRIETATGSSFPSGHSMAATTLYLGLNEYLKNSVFKIMGFILVLCVLFSRPFLGVHYPSDVIMGFIFSIIIFTLMNYLLKYIHVDNLLMLLMVLFHLAYIILKKGDDLRLGAIFLAFTLGQLMDQNFILMENPSGNKQRFWRLLIILIVVCPSYLLLSTFLPHTEIFIYLRYFLTGIALFIVVPLVYKYYNV